jgi:two-component system LytT family response regulator
MAIRCIAIDDEPLALQLLKAYASKIPALLLIQIFEDAVSAMEFIRQHPVDLLFVDIQMPDISGLDLVRNLENKPMIIFTTAHKKFAFEGFELDAVDYLLKPFSLERFSKAVSKAEEYFHYRNAPPVKEEFLYVYAEYKLVKINLNEIEYIESLEDYIRIHLLQSKPILTLMPLKKILEKLPPVLFQRVHRSYIVAVRQIKSVTNKKIMLASTEVPVSDSYLDVIRKLKKP